MFYIIWSVSILCTSFKHSVHSCTLAIPRTSSSSSRNHESSIHYIIAFTIHVCISIHLRSSNMKFQTVGGCLQGSAILQRMDVFRQFLRFFSSATSVVIFRHKLWPIGCRFGEYGGWVKLSNYNFFKSSMIFVVGGGRTVRGGARVSICSIVSRNLVNHFFEFSTIGHCGCCWTKFGVAIVRNNSARQNMHKNLICEIKIGRAHGYPYRLLSRWNWYSRFTPIPEKPTYHKYCWGKRNIRANEYNGFG